MPFVYEYVCERCEHVFTTDSHIARICPRCGKSNMVRRLWSAPGVIYKGDGFYSTDTRKAPEEGT